MDKTSLRDCFIEVLFWLLALVANTEKLVKLDFCASYVIMLGIILLSLMQK